MIPKEMWLKIVTSQYLQFKFELRQHWQQQVAVDVIKLQNEVKNMFGEIADRSLTQHQHLVEKLR